MRIRVLRYAALVGAFALLTAGECTIGTLGDILDQPGKIVVTNTGTEPAVVSIVADDVKSYPTLAGGASSTVTTTVGGTYRLTVIMTPEATLEYRAELTELRRTVEKLIAGTTTPAEKTHAFISLAAIKASIERFESGAGASCSGRLNLDASDETAVNATVAWITQSGSGLWDLTCGSNR